ALDPAVDVRVIVSLQERPADLELEVTVGRLIAPRDWSLQELARTTTRATDFLLPTRGMRERGTYHVLVRGKGLADSFLPLQFVPGTPPVHMARLLPATGRVRGRVVDENGEPIRAVGLQIVSCDGEHVRPPTTSRASSDWDGSFGFQDLPPGRLLVLARKTDYATTSG